MTQERVARELAAGQRRARGGRPQGESPLAAAALRRGDVVVELGSGLGFDSLLAARQVGLAGDVIGVDPSPELVARARANARTVAAPNVTFVLGDAGRLPVPDGSIDVVVSSGAPIRVSSQGPIGEAFRVLRVGGRLAVRATLEAGHASAFPAADPAVASDLARAARFAEIRATLRAAGFHAVTFHGTAERATTVVAVKAAPGRTGAAEPRS